MKFLKLCSVAIVCIVLAHISQTNMAATPDDIKALLIECWQVNKPIKSAATQHPLAKFSLA